MRSASFQRQKWLRPRSQDRKNFRFLERKVVSHSLKGLVTGSWLEFHGAGWGGGREWGWGRQAAF